MVRTDTITIWRPKEPGADKILIKMLEPDDTSTSEIWADNGSVPGAVVYYISQ